MIGAILGPLESARISTFGLVNADSGKENLFFSLDYPREKSYYYGINGERLRTEGALFKKIKEQVAASAHEKLKTAYAIYETNYDSDYVYVMAHSSMVQI